MRLFNLLFMLVFVLACTNVNPPTKTEIEAGSTEDEAASEIHLDRIQLPEGFKIDIYANDVPNARSMALSPSGTLFVGTRSKGSVYALKDNDGDMVADTLFTIMKDGNMPNGVAFKDGDLYVAEVDRILKFENIESDLGNPPEPIVINEDYPSEKHHGWKFISFGPDGKLYVPVGAPCNICDSKDDIFNSITRLNPDGSGREIVHQGIRNTVGFTWHPTTGDLWFTDNGRDMMGDDIPACELNKASTDGLHFGYPYCHQGDLLDPVYGKNADCKDYVPPVQKLGPHTAPLGIEFYTATMFPEKYKQVALIAEHGSWNRKKKIGYRISMVPLDEDTNSKGYDIFADGWLDEETDEAWGRPVDIEFLSDGSMLVSDDFADVIYRISYQG